MTILSNKKTSKGVKGSGGEVDSSDHGGTHTHSISHPLVLPHSQLQLQPESLTLSSAERLFGADRTASASQIWSHSQSISHGHNLSTTREEKRASQTHQYEHIDATAPHGKRRHRASPIRCPRTKHSRLERDRSATSSPNGSPAGSSGGSSPPETTTTICKLPLSSSPEVTYNSEDEYEAQPHAQLTEEEWGERERRFEKKMRKKGYMIKKMGEDGACLFRAVADQVYGDQDMHTVVRKHCMDYIAANGDYYSQYVTEDFNHYVNRKRMEHVHGNHIEIQAMSEMYNRTIEVFCYSTEPINIFHGANQSDNEPIHLSYHRGVHYNSLVDPFKATVGVGLGLPGHIPGLADKNVVKEATRQSEDMLIEQAMLEDKLRATDWEATNEALEEQVARESYLQWLKDNERRNRAARTPTASSSSATATSASSAEVRSPRHRSQGSSNISPIGSPFRGESSFRNSPSRLSPPPSTPGPSKPSNPSPVHSPPRSPANVNTGVPTPTPVNGNGTEPAFQLLETSSFINQLPPELFGMNEWDDAGLLAQVLAVSQQEYLDNLKRTRESPPPTAPPQNDEHKTPQ